MPSGLRFPNFLVCMDTATELKQLVDSEIIGSELAPKLEQLQPGTCCSHRSWGLGIIKDWNTTLGQVIIDFQTKPGHAMEFEYAVASLRTLTPEHIQSRILNNLSEIQEISENDALELMKITVASLGKNATAERIEETLVPAVIPQERWKKWWDGAKRAIKKDPHFVVPTKRSEAIVLHDAPQDAKEELKEAFRTATGPKQTITAIENLLREYKELKDPSFLTEVTDQVAKVLERTPYSQVGMALELVLVRDELLQNGGAELPTGKYAVPSYLPTDADKLGVLLEKVATGKQAKVISRARDNLKGIWPELFLELLPRANSRIAQAIVDAFVDDGRTEEVVFCVQRLLRERNIHPDFMATICRNRKGIFDKLLDGQFFFAALSALEMDQMGGIRRASKLSDIILKDKTLLRDLLAESDEDEVRDVTRAILLSPAFEELDKRSLLAMMVKMYPFVQSMIAGGETKSDTVTLIVSWDSLARREKELEEIVNKKIPQNSKDIAIARSYGDLRENHEFKAAKEMQTVLFRRRDELKNMLLNAQGTDFKDADPSAVNIGTKVELTQPDSREKEFYTILGAWDSEPEKGIISYQTPVAQALYHKRTGEEVDLPLESGGTRRVRIDAISKAVE